MLEWCGKKVRVCACVCARACLSVCVCVRPVPACLSSLSLLLVVSPGRVVSLCYFVAACLIPFPFYVALVVSRSFRLLVFVAARPR